METVLLVDDYADARKMVRELLEENGHAVIEASNGQQALDLLVSQGAPRIALIVLDLKMPVMDGVQFLAVLRSYVRLSMIPVVVASAHTNRLGEHDRSRIVGCFQAPFDMNELLEVVNTCLAQQATRV